MQTQSCFHPFLTKRKNAASDKLNCNEISSDKSNHVTGVSSITDVTGQPNFLQYAIIVLAVKLWSIVRLDCPL